MIRQRCRDCGCLEGELHKPGCDMEWCPFCGRQLISCDCAYEKLGIDISEGTWAYEHGLTKEQGRKWNEILEKKGLIPYVAIPDLCALCGEVEPEFFHVSDREWQKYVIPKLQREVLCFGCYLKQKRLFPDGWRNLRTLNPQPCFLELK